MKPHPRIRKFFKWGGLTLSVLLLFVWLGSAYSFWAKINFGQNTWIAASGAVMIFRHDNSVPPLPFTIDYGLPTVRLVEWRGAFEKRTFQWVLSVPLWPFVIISIFATAAAWRMDTLAQRRKRIGACPACGYDRTGLAANAPCPECNAAA